MEHQGEIAFVRNTEDQYHFMLVYPYYTELRRKKIKNYFCSWPTFHKVWSSYVSYLLENSE